MTLHPEHVGQRVVVRVTVPGELGPSGGPAMTDVLGILEAHSAETLVVRRLDDVMVTILRRDIVTSKPVPPRPSARHRISAADLQRICAAGWVAPVLEHLGDWLLRAAGGFTGRANSVLATGDPGVATDTALEAVSRFYTRLHLPSQAAVIVGSEELSALTERGWTRSRPQESDTLVQIASVSMARRAAHDRSAVEDVKILEQLTDGWMTRYGRTAGAESAAVRAVLSSGDRVAFAQLGEPAVAIGRGVLTGDWLGLSAVDVDEPLRGTGRGEAIVDALLAWGAARGARSAYLQALGSNEHALSLYARYGFTTHHAYRYLRPGLPREGG